MVKNVIYTLDVRTDIYEKGDLKINISGVSSKWKHRLCMEDEKVCVGCDEEHGHIYSITVPDYKIKLNPWHYFCRCDVFQVQTILRGAATNKGQNGADFYLFNFNILPNYYISIEEAYALGWKSGKDLSKFAPSKMLAKGVYMNYNGHLPTGRTWYEADINYISGKRNKQRVLYSNDGLIFVTYDHYRKFYEIV